MKKYAIALIGLISLNAQANVFVAYTGEYLPVGSSVNTNSNELECENNNIGTPSSIEFMHDGTDFLMIIDSKGLYPIREAVYGGLGCLVIEAITGDSNQAEHTVSILCPNSNGTHVLVEKNSVKVTKHNATDHTVVVGKEIKDGAVVTLSCVSEINMTKI